MPGDASEENLRGLTSHWHAVVEFDLAMDELSDMEW